MQGDKTHKTSLFRSWSFGKTNYLFFGIGLAVIALGYILMTTGNTNSFQSVKVSPIILTIGYCVIIPFAILYHPRD